MQLALGTLEETLSQQSSGSYRNSGLDNVISRPQRIQRGVYEDEHSKLLILLQHGPPHRQGPEDRTDHDQQIFLWCAGHHKGGEYHHGINCHGTKIRLKENKNT